MQKSVSTKKRCHALTNGKRCIRPIKTAGLCFGHAKELESKQAFDLRDMPLDSVAIGFEGDEEALAQLYGRNHVK